MPVVQMDPILQSLKLIYLKSYDPINPANLDRWGSDSGDHAFFYAVEKVISNNGLGDEFVGTK